MSRYISGDNGASAEGMLNGTPNEFTTFNGVPVPVKAQYLWYPFWGSDKRNAPVRSVLTSAFCRFNRRSQKMPGTSIATFSR
jgi:hypothetical protein